jgi:ABC-type sugar transport system ATPase subunit
VFQNYALYPHLSVARNLSLALEVRRRPAAEIAARVRETAALLGIEDLLERRPRQLSGGQQQRVALGRALARRPRLYLMDEPLSNLDALLREGMRSELKALFRRLQATVLYVTHDQAEALSLADEVLVLERGRVRQCAPPLELYERPADLFVASFVGSPRMTLWRGRRSDGAFEAGGLRIALPAGLPGGGELSLGLRPEDIAVSDAALPGAWQGTLELSEPGGDRVLLTLRVGELRLRAFAPPRAWGERLWARANPERLHWFDAASGKRLA